MEVVIDTYKGFEIRFDTERETFLCDIDDAKSVKKSFSAIKNFIKEWLKEADNFRKFKIQGSPDTYKHTGQILTIIGIHGNGNPVFENANGKIEQLSLYDCDKYVLYTPDNDPLWVELKTLEDKQSVLNKQIREVKAKFTGKTVKEYLKEIQ